MARERRKWTAAEDELLKAAVSRGFESNGINWHAVASRVPGRTNKDCRKRWHYKVATNVNTGTWTAAEDKRLQRAVGKHGMKWALVATEVENRNGDQCSKRWKDSIDPDIDHSPWKPEEDQLLLQSVEQYGRNWKAISGIQFERRPPLALKNRYSLLQRHIGGSRPARESRRAGPNNSARTSRSASGNRYHRESEGDDIDDSMDGGSSSGDYEISNDVETSRGSPFSQKLPVQSTVPLSGAKPGTPESENQDTRYRSPEHRSSLNFNPSSTDLLSLCSDNPMVDISGFNINPNMNFGTLQESPNGTGNGIIPISAPMLPIQSSSNSCPPTWDSVSTTIHSTSQISDGSFEPQKPQAPTLDSFQSSPSQLSPSHWSAALTESPRQQPNSNRVSPSQRNGPTVLGSTREGDLRKQVTITAFCDPERIGKLLQVVMEAVNSVTNEEEDTTVLLNVK